MPNGSLEKFIFDVNTPNKNHHLGWEALDRIALGIARGLEYLHRGCNTRILHFDIKPHNILLDENFTPKISDFGLARICNMKESIVSMACARGAFGYIAPEVFSRNFGGVSHKSDVYSYGIMLSEMVGGRRNINAEAEDTSEIYFPHWIYKRIELDEELGLPSIVNEEDKVRARKMVIVSLWCIQTDPSNRPAMKDVIDMFEGSVIACRYHPSLTCLLLQNPPQAGKNPSVGTRKVFQLSCHGDGEDAYPLLQLSGNNYIIHNIDYQRKSLLVSNSLLSGYLESTACNNDISSLHNLTLPNDQFELASNQADFFLLYNCNSSVVESFPKYKVGCFDQATNKTRSNTSVLALPRDEYPKLGSDKCRGEVVVAHARGGYENGEVGLIQEVLSRGFELNWFASDCSRCQDSGGRCGFNYTTYHFRCLCPRQTFSLRCGSYDEG
ncbi:PREDICTED: LEAF RUST 10 DISEASE-RESISTANCE [Prunus dulcis]|uniref:PREDICTED: LEAF RUST 10 DISEASE-RESISTANCE n=1 Tax=Prunus dulcis TaxID=3755 RepID=A0A5E4GKC1_PRUDU|nr:PREDICTED: LEAF RUST 10 DISEASE-RESISTANCE [Prunus dulcis]